jgi:glutamine synthetase
MPANDRSAKKNGGMTREKAREFFKANQIKFVLAQFVDIHGVAKTKAVPVEHFEDVILEDGAGLPASRCGAWDRRRTIPTIWRSATSRP